MHRFVCGTIGALLLVVAGWSMKSFRRRQGMLSKDPELHPLHGKPHGKGRGKDKLKGKPARYAHKGCAASALVNICCTWLWVACGCTQAWSDGAWRGMGRVGGARKLEGLMCGDLLDVKGFFLADCVSTCLCGKKGWTRSCLVTESRPICVFDVYVLLVRQTAACTCVLIVRGRAQQ